MIALYPFFQHRSIENIVILQNYVMQREVGVVLISPCIYRQISLFLALLFSEHS